MFITSARHLLPGQEFLDLQVEFGWASQILGLRLWPVRVITPHHLICPGQWPGIISPNAWAVLKCNPPPQVWWACGLGSPTGTVWKCWELSAVLIHSPGPSLLMAAWLPMTPCSPMAVADGMAQPLNFIFKESCSCQCLPVGIPCHS